MLRLAILTAWASLSMLSVVQADDEVSAEIAAAVADLDATDLDARERAVEVLWRIGDPAIPALERAASTGGPEARARAREILARLSSGLRAHMGPKLSRAVRIYEEANLERRPEILEQLAEAGPDAVFVLVALARRDGDPAAMEIAIDSCSREARQLLIEGRAREARDLLERGAELGKRPAADLAAFIARSEDVEEGKRRCGDLGLHAALAYLHWASGDFRRAAEAARASGDPALRREMLAGAEDWSGFLEALDVALDRHGWDADLPLMALADRLGGSKQDFEDSVAAIARSRFLIDHECYRELSVGPPAMALWLLGRPREAIDLLTQDRDPLAAFPILCAQLRHREAIERVPGRRRGAETLALARLHLDVGDRPRAVALLSAMGDGRGEWLTSEVVQLWVELGRPDEARRIWSRAHSQGDPGSAPFYGSVEGTAARMWARLLAEDAPWEAPDRRLARVERLVAGKAPDLEDRLADARRRLLGSRRPEDRARWLEGLIAACWNTGHLGEAISILEGFDGAHPGSGALLRAGDLRSLLGQHAEAAETYRREWDRTRSIPALYLFGRSIERCGQEARGREAMSRARSLPLGCPSERDGLIRALEERGIRDPDLDRSRDLAWADPCHAESAERLERDARRAEAAGMPRHALRLWRRYQIERLATAHRAYFLDPALDVVLESHRRISRILLDEGRVDEAIAEAWTCLAIAPGDIELALAIVPALERAGRREDAQAILDAVRGSLTRAIDELPETERLRTRLERLGAVGRGR